ncbi:N-acetylmuramoyl-L-alanine amidase [Corynebacterium frankenforstense]|nr:N-acetylmuramoyl-L-alanine amidase [Corynebacterium frankenforstense]
MKRHRPTLAVVSSVALLAAAVFGGNQVLNTQSDGSGPVDVLNVSESFADGDNVAVDDAAINAQGGEGERTVKEFTRDEEFSMFALTWEGPRDVAAYVRAEIDGQWGPWHDLEPIGETAGDKHGTELIYVEPTHKVQVSTAGVDLLGGAADGAADGAAGAAPGEENAADGAADAAPEGDENAENAEPEQTAPARDAEPAAPASDDAASESDGDDRDAGGAAPMPADYAGIRPVAETEDTSATDAEDLSAVFIDGNAQAGIAPTAETDGMPSIVSRGGWGANESKRCMSPQIDDHVSALTIHHTAGSNNYSRAQAAAQVRGIYNYHAVTLGWCDIGYNALVDKYGTIYEGRYGGLTKAVQGAHAGGFNQNTWGISMIGDYTSTTPPEATIEAVGKLAGWRAAVAGFDPTGRSTHYSEGTSYTKYPAGTPVTLPNIFAHRDVGRTTCPGDAGYAQMDRIRQLAKAQYSAIKGGATGAEQSTSTTTSPGTSDQTSTPSTTTQSDGTSTTSTTTPQSNSTTTTTNQRAANTGDAPRGPLAGGDRDVTEILKGLTSDSRAEQVAAVGGLAALGIAAVLANPDVRAEIGQLGDVKVLNDITLRDVPPIIDKLVTLSGNSEIEAKWRDINAVFGPVLGSARSGVTTTPAANGGETSYALFDNGIITSSDAAGTHALWGAIADAWAKQGFDSGPLGLPTGEQRTEGGVQKVDFQNGLISYDPATGAVDINLAGN